MDDNTGLFSGRSDNYSKYRPSYPLEIIALLEKNAGLTRKSVVADIGSGTGILSRLFVENGNSVFCVEPNPDMRKKAENNLSGAVRCRIIDGTAENTTLPESSVDLVTAGQSFHWFNPDKAAGEFRRILRNRGKVALIWNDRVDKPAGMNHDYERVCKRYSPAYHSSGSLAVSREVIRGFFGGDQEEFTIRNEQRLDLEGVKGRYLSASYALHVDDASFPEVMRSFEEAFRKNQAGGFVSLEYATRVFLGIPDNL